MILIDTKVISEFMRPSPDTAVTTWMRKHPRNEVWTASIVIAEIFSGIEFVPAGKKQVRLREQIEGMIYDFRGQILRFDVPAARCYGSILSSRRGKGRPIREMDALIAAIAKANGATLATRNTADFEDCGIQLVNPWNAV